MSSSAWIKKALEDFEVPLMKYATSILGDVDRARDVVQETFLRLCRQDPAQVRGHLAPWLFRVCRNRAVDLLRREGRMSVLPSDGAGPRDTAPGPGALLERRETLSLIERFLKDLSANQREVVRLKFQSGLSYKEISEVTGLSVSNVGFLIHTAIKTLRQRLRAEPPQSRLRRVK